MSEPSIFRWLCEPLPKDVAQSLDRLAAALDVRHLAVMPDVHLASDVCVGVALATRTFVYPAAVGGDIGCGMAAVAIEAQANSLDESSAVAILKGLACHVPAMRHSRATLPELPDEVLRSPLSHPRLSKLVDRDGRVQFGTLGRGNHFLEIQADQDDGLWIMLHSGSRAMGQAITAHHMAIAEQQSGRRKLPSLDSQSSEGVNYLADVAWAEQYASSSRLAMLQAAAAVIEGVLGFSISWQTLLHSNHNHVHRETHFGEELLVHRKGALPAQTGQPGVIPGSMGSESFHVTGRGCPTSLCSSSHGAGRAMSRGQAAQRVSLRQLQHEMRGVWYDMSQSRFLIDEAPSAYKDVLTVMRAQRELTRIERQLKPILNYKGT